MLEDVLQPGLVLVICGSAAGVVSAARGQYYAGPGNRFWHTLRDVGLTPRLLAPADYRELPSFGIGLTDIAKGQSGSDTAIDFARADSAELRLKLHRFAPRILAFNGRKAAQVFLGRSRVETGPQPEMVGTTRLFVAPSTSGAASGYWDVGVWRELAGLVRGSA